MSDFINNMKSIFKKEDIITAKSAYYFSTYNRFYTDEELFSDLLKDIKTLIETKMRSNKYCAMIEVTKDKEKFLPEVIKRYRDAGYDVMEIGKDTVINGSKMDNLTSTFVFFVWNMPFDEYTKNDTVSGTPVTQEKKDPYEDIEYFN